MTLSVGFIGAGGIASVHLETLDSVIDSGLKNHNEDTIDVELTAVADINESRARKAASHDAAIYTDGLELLKSESIDAVVVTVPPFAHGDYERTAAKYGIDLFVEKPVDLSIDTARETARQIEESNILAQVGYVCRYGRITERALELLDGRQIGHIDSTYWAPIPETSWWREQARSGGQIVEQSTHVYDLHRYLAGEVTDVIGIGTDQLLVDEIDFQDATSVTLNHESGAVSHISSTCSSPTFRFEVRIAAEDAYLELDYADHSLSGTVDGQAVQFETDDDWYSREFKAFMHAVTERNRTRSATSKGVDVRSDFEDAVKTLDLTLTARDAAESSLR
ncbi:Gfo/Idh/MocA family protein [Haladaptatus pallidirubidus]|uniref:Gfo/Idh/MocA family oxidoreductase n=1 Tax=Haladaptatus pallidirubidus TaxID=1008152 RepID=A0AAV3UI15_9EURY|nr:Gfo/Idh/MocA family oxidoreductase [Haladaptatus pallidirubidus]